ncbi:ABC transporter ATP-binding protein [Paeniglutamicibacter kerguelensis]|uniref:Simple sugar transport system ATP-binding protein n=1 Tax=Paeniglutamicibacter kerguelensis TaxID=254788 RepID=A0ABS4XL17_9MICC|nr:ABC transporter ATP-binding protein [Paeniglutamicibacter kerguelensis]MBP2388389.1 simple sugar transport system ATP-binding protein [Paeniglutamicibacter kerguelensis]
MPSNDAHPTRPVLELRQITKTFGPVVANKDVDFDLAAGEIHALVGENGAGKTTLMRILYGMYQPDGGSISMDGQPVGFKKPMDAINHGIGMVHQHFMLVPGFTVAENVTLGAEPRHNGLFDHAAANESLLEPMKRLGISLDPETITGTLNVATQQKLEIIKVLYRGARIIILDEPTAVLTPQETEELFILLKTLAKDGASVIFISHKLREVFAVADRITVLRNGQTIQTFTAAQTDAASVVAAMTGRTDVNLGRVQRTQPGDGTVLEVTGLNTDKFGSDAALKSVSFSVRPGEVLGIAGVEGNGQSTLAEALVGIQGLTGGTILLRNDELEGLNVADRRSKGLSYVAEDRHLEGIPLNGSVLEGISAGLLRRDNSPAGLGIAFSRGVRQWAVDMIGKYGIKTSGPDAKCSTLSGGNQQKIVMARELEDNPHCIILAQPTRGVDLGAIEFLYNQVAEATAAGCAVVLISADMDEILRLSDRVLVMYGGEVVAEQQTVATSREALGMYMMGAQTMEVAR